VLNACGFDISWCTKFGKKIYLNLGARCAYMMYSRHSNLVQLFGDDFDGFRSGLDVDGSDIEICGGVRLEGVNFPYLGFLSPQTPLIL
jgi:hypothetical protein